MTPHSSNESDDCVQSTDPEGVTSPCHDGTSSQFHLQKEMENKINEMQEQLASYQRELAITQLNVRMRDQRLLEKEDQSNQIREIRNKMLDNKEKELQEAKVQMEDLELRNRQLETQLQQSVLDPVEDESNCQSVDAAFPLFPPSTLATEKEETSYSGDDDKICPYCDSPKEDSQDWAFHYDNCPDSLKWRGDDTNHTGHYQRMS